MAAALSLGYRCCPPPPPRLLNRAGWGKGRRRPAEHEGLVPRRGTLARWAKGGFPQRTAHFGQRLGFMPHSQIHVQLPLALSGRRKLSLGNRVRDPAPGAFSAVGQSGFRIKIAKEAGICQGPRDAPERRPGPFRPGGSPLSAVETPRKRKVGRKRKRRCASASGCEESSLSAPRGASRSLAPRRAGAGGRRLGRGCGEARSFLGTHRSRVCPAERERGGAPSAPRVTQERPGGVGGELEHSASPPGGRGLRVGGGAGSPTLASPWGAWGRRPLLAGV